MRIGNIEDTLYRDITVVLKDGSVNLFPLQKVIAYEKDSRKAIGVGVPVEEFIRELKEYGEVHISHSLDYREGFDVIKANTIEEIYTVKMRHTEHPIQIVKPKKGIRKLLWRLSNL